MVQFQDHVFKMIQLVIGVLFLVLVKVFLFSFLFLFIYFLKKNKSNFLQCWTIDVNECLINHGGCDANAKCENTPGSFSCSCNQGYFGNGFVCNGMIVFYCFIILPN